MIEHGIAEFSGIVPPDTLYTRLYYIEQEVRYWRSYFKDKVVLCNCDDPFESYFFKYFARNFQALQLKKLIAVSYENSPIANKELTFFHAASQLNYKSCMIELADETTCEKIFDLTQTKLLLNNGINSFAPLSGNGDFRSYECMKILKKADVAVTHPPFSLLREYIELMINFRKKFLLIGNACLTSCTEIAGLIRQKKLIFRPLECRSFRWITANKCRQIKIPNAGWFTNLPCLG